QLRRHIRIAFIVAFCEPQMQAEVIILKVPILPQFADKPLHRWQWLRREHTNDTYPLLRPRACPPGGCCATEERDELASSHWRALPTLGSWPRHGDDNTRKPLQGPYTGRP